MAGVIFRYPSKVPYGYVELSFEMDELKAFDSANMAELYVEKFSEYREAEAAALAAGPKKKSLDKGVAEILSEDEATELVKSELGATEVDDKAPWEKPAPEPTIKPYEEPVDWSFG